MSDKHAVIKKVVTLISLILIPMIIVFGMLVWDDRKYYIVSIAVIVLSIALFAFGYERRKPGVREVAILTVMTAIAVVSRVAFYLIPQFKPMLAVVIITGVALGKEFGFLCGSLSAFISNIYFGQGPWTPWQMFACGIIGFFAGILFCGKTIEKLRYWVLCGYGFISTFIIYGFLLDTYSLFSFSTVINSKMLLSVYAAGVPFNLVHAICTLTFLVITAKPMTRMLARIKVKYGLFT